MFEKLHKCLLCPLQIPLKEVYCTNCGYDVWAVRANAQDHGGRYMEQWETLQQQIKKAVQERDDIK